MKVIKQEIPFEECIKQRIHNVNRTHYKIGKIVRNAIKKAGGTMPESLSTPKKSLKQLEKENKQKLNFL